MSPRKLDDVTLGVFGDHDSGYGQTYAEDCDEGTGLDDGSVQGNVRYSLRFGKKRKRLEDDE